MRQKTFLISLAAITLLGFLLRLNGYDRTPGWNESLDEIHYAWTGQTWLKTGTPASWSFLSSYPTSHTVQFWDTDFRLVSPMLEKPPLYSLLSGALVLGFGEDDLVEVRISVIRLLPLTLSLLTIFLTGILGRKVFSPQIGLVGALLYATTAPIVLANRLSVTENLLTPLMLSVQLILLTTSLSRMRPHLILVSIFSALSILTKQIGIVVGAASLLIFILQKKWKSFFVCAAISGIAFLIYPAIGYFYDWNLFGAIQTEQRRIGLQGGLPQLIQTVVTRPLITTEKMFPDGVLLLGYMLLFTSPWLISSLRGVLVNTGTTKQSYLITNNQQLTTYNIFLIFPFAYLAYLALAITGAEPIGSGQGFWGWYTFPLFPYVTILVAVVSVKLWQSATIFTSLIITLILGSSMIRYVFLSQHREFHYRWQPALIILLFITLTTTLLPETYRKRVLILLFAIFIGVNLYTSMNLSLLYSNNPQPIP